MINEDLRQDKQAQAKVLREALRRLIVAHASLNDSRRPCGTALPVPHAWALLELHQHGAMTITDLAARLNIDRTNVSRLCARMANIGELERAEHPDDGRARLVQLTDVGTQVARGVDASSAAHFQDILNHLSADADVMFETLNALTQAILLNASKDNQ